MKSYNLLNLIYFLLITISTAAHWAWAQQNVTIAPGDDVIAKMQSVTEAGSTITFEPGRFLITPKADGTPGEVFFTVPADTITIRGAGGGMDPSASTILDFQFSFANAFEIGVNQFTLEGVSILRLLDAGVAIEQGVDGVTFNDVWIGMMFESTIETEGSTNTNFTNCVFGWSGDELIKTDDNVSNVRFLNCDFFHGTSNLMEVEGGADVKVLNSIFYAGSGAGSDQIAEEDGLITIVSSVLWDPFEADPANRDPLNGGLNTGIIFLDPSLVGADPEYVLPPGAGTGFEAMDLRLKEGSPALTAGSDEFEDDLFPIGQPTYAGSQGPAPTTILRWRAFSSQ